MTPGGLEILYEDNHLLAVNKPPGLPTMGVKAHQTSLVTLAKQYIKRRYRKPGNVYLGVMSRLDAGTSGVVILARTSKAAARLTEQFRKHQVGKTYWALVS
ncbi:MAG: pseudouridine synthase, partial [Pirellulales bacterium]